MDGSRNADVTSWPPTSKLHLGYTLLVAIMPLRKAGIARKTIQFYSIPGHCGIEVNERVDSEAKQAMKEGRHSQLLLPVADLKTQWKKKGKEELHSC
jgi:hypothetical protein